MALVPCPDCGTEISDLAPACVKCGRPARAAAGTAKHVQTVQLTSKMWKGVQLAGGLIMIFGFVSCVAVFGAREPEERTLFANTGVQSCAWGLGIWVVGKVGGWWAH